MKNLIIGDTNLEASEIGLGCMRITELQDKKEVRNLIDTAMDQGIDFFDHADIYAKGYAEEVFGEVVDSAMRQNMIIQSKCGIIPGKAYDFSKEHILESVDESLKRLRTDYLDILLLHRPDTLMEPEEVAEAFEILETTGKVRYFGVSNQNSMQIELLNKYCENRIKINQLQFSIAHCDIVDSGLNVNVHNEAGANRDGSVLEYCRLKNITIQAWSPFQYGMFEGVFLNSEKFPELNRQIEELAEKYQVTNSAIAVAWILRHPAKIQTIVGTTNKNRLTDICKASEVNLTGEEWYALYMAAGKVLP
ncbi:MAG: aldo/keto reductase [Blautia sp.]|uniref:aldo/keto reductase n=1 Tax=Blautia sp. TaxID=1955243 RepID=UPI002E77E913|nr:aldo/keto reductase [Blautia sp.]MEE1444905.1 aldo/keto reductase [Blautia sp.]